MIDTDYISDFLLRLLRIHSPSGYTDPVVRLVSDELQKLGVHFELTRRGAIRATLPGSREGPGRAVVTHLDTLGAMVKRLKTNGRLEIVPVGTWSSRFAEGARVSVFTDDNIIRGTILPLKASGHIFNEAVDNQPSSWEHLEIRLDEVVSCRRDLEDLGLRVGDFVGVDSQAEKLANGFINARHLDDKAGVAAVLGVIEACQREKISLPVDCHPLFTISEEVGSGASAVLQGDIAEMVSVDNGTVGPGQNSREFGVTIAMADSTGPFDYHLTHQLIALCQDNRIPVARDVFKFYRCDSASAVDAGNDIRTALVCFGVDSSHGYERTHFDAIHSVAALLLSYLQSPLLYDRQDQLNSLETFPETRTVEVKSFVQEGSARLAQDLPLNHREEAQADPDDLKG
ncbi:MAG: osmoprotectant NAGGN system M42 family peptidase [Puniceicoccaceae bacterium]